MRTEDFDYHLPSELIAQRPAKARDQSRLLVVHRSKGAIEHKRFTDLGGFLSPCDVLVLNDTRVVKCRLFGKEARHGRKVELFLVRELEDGSWEMLVRPGKRARPGDRISLGDGFAVAEVLENTPDGRRRVRIESDQPVSDLMRKLGHVPLPPYIKRDDEADDETSYQTVFARDDGAVAAPTAGLHFTEKMLGELREAGVETAYVTLHVGPGTFKPVRTSDPTQHKLEAEWFRLKAEQAAKVNEARRKGRAFCVGTTVARVMETVARRAGSDVGSSDAARGARVKARRAGNDAKGGAVDNKAAGTGNTNEKADRGGGPGWIVEPGEGWTDKYILPPYDFRVVDRLLTNFHLPRTTLLMLVSAFAGRELLLKAYEEAVAERYRFYSYGDAMLIL